MSESLAEQLQGSTLKETLLATVASQDLDSIPPDFDDRARFVICAVRAVAHRDEKCALCVLLYSEAPRHDGRRLGFSRIAHMQDGHGSLAGNVIFTNRDANNGAYRSLSSTNIADAMDEVEGLGFGNRAAVVWDGNARCATVYPEGFIDESKHFRFHVPESDGSDVSQDDVCRVLDIAYADNLKNPSGRTAKLWSGGKLVSTAEDEIERHLKGQMSLFFAGCSRPIRVLSQTHTSAGRTDLILIQKPSNGGPRLSGVVELKVLRGPISADRTATTEGLSQGYHYRRELELPFATLALYDVSTSPAEDPAPLLEDQHPDHLKEVRVRRFPIYSSPKEWRDAAATKVA